MSTLVDICVLRVNPYPADHDYCRFQSVLFVDQITVIGKRMSKRQDLQMFVLKLTLILLSKFLKNFNHFRLWIAVARHNLKWLKFFV